MFSKTICFVATSNTPKYCYKVVFLFQSFLVITEARNEPAKFASLSVKYLTLVSILEWVGAENADEPEQEVLVGWSHTARLQVGHYCAHDG